MKLINVWNLKYRLVFDLNLVYKIPGVRRINFKTIKLHILTVAVLKPVEFARYIFCQKGDP